MITKALFFGILASLLTLGSTGCSTFNQSTPQVFKVERSWAVGTFSKPNSGIYKWHAGTPVPYNKSVLVANAFDGVGLYSQKFFGREIWKLQVPHGCESTPVIREDTGFVGCNDGNFYSIDLKNGTVNWKYSVNFEGLGSPTLTEDAVIFTTGKHVVYSLNIKTGKPNWLYTRKVGNSFSVRGQSKAVVEGNIIYVGFSDGYLVALKKSAGVALWEKYLNENRRFKDIDASPVIEGARLYTSGYDDHFYAIDKGTSAVIWKSPFGSHTAPLIDGDAMYVSTSKGQLAKLNKNTGKNIWQIDLPGGVGTTPIIYKGILLLGESNGQILAISQVDGSVLSSYDTGKGIVTPLVETSKPGRFLALSRGGLLFSIKADWVKATHLWPWDQ